MEQYLADYRMFLDELDKLREDNHIQMMQLAAAIRAGMSRSRVEKAEYYQSLFINKETAFQLLRQEIREQIEHISENCSTCKTGCKSRLPMYFALKRNMETLANEHQHLRSEFALFLQINSA